MTFPTRGPRGFSPTPNVRFLPLALVILCVLGGVVAAQDRGTQWEHADTIGLDEVGSGELLWKTERGFVPLPVADIDVELTVTGVLVHGRLRQTFHNPTSETIEALYAFPLPEGAAVHHMEMLIGDRRIVAVIREKQEARRTYEEAKRKGHKAALVDQRRPNLFTTAAANLGPGESIAVELQYLDDVPCRDGRFDVRFPLTFTPRYVPPGHREPRAPALAQAAAVSASSAGLVPSPHGVRAPQARVRVDLRVGAELERLVSATHAIQWENETGRFRVRTAAPTVVADRDFVLSWRPALAGRPQASVFVEHTREASYALMMLLPPIPGSEAGLGLPTETLFVVDVSGSMSGPSIEQARQALLAAIGRLRGDDTFNILKFNDSNAAFRDGFRFAGEDELDSAREWVRGLEAGGGTMIYPALMRGLQMLAASDTRRAQRLIFLTDGAVANEDEVLRGIVEMLGDARLHTIGIGQAPNAFLMRKMAWFGRGLSEFVAHTHEAENRIDSFLARLDRPVLTDVELRGDAVSFGETYPSRLPDLHAGQPLMLYARLDTPSAGASVTLSGYTRAGWIETSVSIDDALEGRGIATRWARSKVGALMDSLHEGADPEHVKTDVVDLGLRFNLVTRYTSLVAVEQLQDPTGDSLASQPRNALPMGGTDAPARRLVGALLASLGLVLLAGRRWVPS